MKNLSTKSCWKLLGGASSLLICAGSLAACLISNNNQNQIKSTNNTISNDTATISAANYFTSTSNIGRTITIEYSYNEENQRYEGTITNGKSITGNDLDLVFGSDPVECNGENVYITSIGDYAFKDSSTSIWQDIRSVTFKSGGIKTIGAYAFYMLDSIQTIINRRQ